MSLPDDVFTIMSKSLTPRDVCSLSLCCRNLNELAVSDKVWVRQCKTVGVGFVGYRDIVEWREGVSCYKSLCRFLLGVKPLIGIWVHQNPELGNVVYVMPGFVSVVGCRIIPQELGPLGIEDGPLLWASVFEVIGDFDGSLAFFLHGRERDCDYVYPGLLKPVNGACNVLLLEVEPRNQSSGGKLLHSKSLSHHNLDRRIRRPDTVNGVSRSQRVSGLVVSFSRLAFGDRRRLLELVADQVRLKVPDLAIGPLFPQVRDDGEDDVESLQKDMKLLSERRLQLMNMYKLGMGRNDGRIDPSQAELSKIKKSFNGEECHMYNTKRKNIAGYFKDSLKSILGRSSSINGGRSSNSRSSSSNSENKHVQLHEFLKSGDTIGLSLQASTVKLSTYRAWPNMHDNRFALYKLPMRIPASGQEYSGLWGGTFGWPPGRPTEDKPGKALFFLVLSYQESEGQRLLIATKILEGTHYVLHPNGSAMFVVKVDEISPDTFPWYTYEDSRRVDVKCAYNGEGIANGYGFRYPGSKPGSLFIIEDGLLAFVWKESRAVLTLKRLNLQELLKKGERVPSLPPIVNFAYLTKSYSNVFAGFSNTNCFSSTRYILYYLILFM
ncbi:hypothetical protein GIB67_001533 [Kingdonia uniflora]|uniref:F-box domain-containing protein n=1 Tax=Kingdonia uniflora TaxID=39325 RepID=A0A7J7LZK2_9MAGN|nr:hypothetical protein GIB67_001533 [Kingdonia uniflora]